MNHDQLKRYVRITSTIAIVAMIVAWVGFALDVKSGERATSTYVVWAIGLVTMSAMNVVNYRMNRRSR